MIDLFSYFSTFTHVCLETHLLTKNLGKRVFCGLLSLLFCCSIVAPQSYALTGSQRSTASGAGLQMAEILEVRPQLDRLSEIAGRSDGNAEQERLALKSQILQKILIGYLEVRRASDKNWRELSYSFNIMRREQRKQDLINQCFTLANFAQLSALYTTEPFLRLDNKFKASGCCTQTGGGLGLTLPVLSMVQQKHASVKDTAPPEAMHEIIDAGPVDASGLPPYVARYLDAPEPGATVTRKQAMFDSWKKRFGVDASNRDNLCSLNDENRTRKTIGTLHKRILLLFSLYTYVHDMDDSLLALLRQVQSVAPGLSETQATGSDLAALGLSAHAVDAAKLLGVQGQAAELISLNRSGNASFDHFGRLKLEENVLEKILTGALEVRAAVDQVDNEINYASDVVLSELLAKQGQKLQLNYEANFIQAGTFGSIAGLLYLKGFSKGGNEMFVISGGIGTCLSTLALRLMKGGHRAIDTEPNSLADVFGLQQQGEYRFSPFIASFLNSASPDTKNGITRRQELEQYWKEKKVTTVKLGDKKTRDNLAAMPSAQADTIKIVTNRIVMLHRLLAELELLDPELLDLLHATEGSHIPSALQGSAQVSANLTPSGNEAANLLEVQPVVARLRSSAGNSVAEPGVPGLRLMLMRKVFTTALDVRATIDTLDDEISYESDVLGRMTRCRDHVVAVTNNLNFYQLNILAIIIDGILVLSGNTRWGRASNMLNIVSGLSVGGFAAATVLEQRGGWRPLPSRLNMLGQCLGMAPPDQYRFSPVVWKYINSVPPTSSTGRTRVENLRMMWKQSKHIYPNMDKQSMREKVAAFGPAHSERCETIKLVKDRLNMLYDVQGLVGLFDTGLDELLR